MQHPEPHRNSHERGSDSPPHTGVPVERRTALWVAQTAPPAVLRALGIAEVNVRGPDGPRLQRLLLASACREPPVGGARQHRAQSWAGLVFLPLPSTKWPSTGWHPCFTCCSCSPCRHALGLLPLPDCLLQFILHPHQRLAPAVGRLSHTTERLGALYCHLTARDCSHPLGPPPWAVAAVSMLQPFSCLVAGGPKRFTHRSSIDKGGWLRGWCLRGAGRGRERQPASWRSVESGVVNGRAGWLWGR